jgi:hypothetical protein
VQYDAATDAKIDVLPDPEGNHVKVALAELVLVRHSM